MKLGKGFRPCEPRSMRHARAAPDPMQSRTGFAILLPARRSCERVFHTATWRTGSHASHPEARWRAEPVTGQDKVASLCKPPLILSRQPHPFPGRQGQDICLAGGAGKIALAPFLDVIMPRKGRRPWKPAVHPSAPVGPYAYPGRPLAVQRCARSERSYQARSRIEPRHVRVCLSAPPCRSKSVVCVTSEAQVAKSLLCCGSLANNPLSSAKLRQVM